MLNFKKILRADSENKADKLLGPKLGQKMTHFGLLELLSKNWSLFFPNIITQKHEKFQKKCYSISEQSFLLTYIQAYIDLNLLTYKILFIHENITPKQPKPMNTKMNEPSFLYISCHYKV